MRIALDYAIFVAVIISTTRSIIIKTLLILVLGEKEALVFILSRTGTILDFFLIIFSILLGIFLSRNNLKSRYFIGAENKNEIIKLSTVFFVLIMLIYLLYLSLQV